MPYFENDFWPNFFEDSIKSCDYTEDRLKAELASQIKLVIEQNKELFFVFRLLEETEITSSVSRRTICERTRDRGSLMIDFRVFRPLSIRIRRSNATLWTVARTFCSSLVKKIWNFRRYVERNTRRWFCCGNYGFNIPNKSRTFVTYATRP